MDTQRPIILAFLVFSVSVVHTATHPNDLALLNQFKHGLENAELLEWPSNGDDPCGPPAWPHIYCSGNRVSQIQVRGLGLKGPLPPNFNQLSMLQNLGLQDNHFTGELPSFNGLSELRYAYLDYNDFDTIPSDFFKGLVNLEVLALDYNPLNATNGWSLPSELQGSAQLKNLSLMGCNLAGSLPEFLGNMSSLEVLKLSLNRITGDIPGRFRESELKILWLNEQSDGMIGPIDVITSITSLISLWLHGNRFSGEIPDNIGDLVSLNDLNLNGNDLVGFVPSSLANMELQHLDLNNNHFIGSVPKFKAVIATYASNPFCLPLEGSQCSPDVMALLDFLRGLNYPSKLVESWSGNDPCRSWLGIGCDPNGEVITINLHNSNLSGALSSSIANLDSLTHIYLQSNNLSGPIPAEWTSLKSLVVLNLSQNNISPPIPVFGSNVELSLSANSLLDSNSSSGRSTNASSEASPSSPVQSSSSSDSVTTKHSSGSKLLVVVAPVGSFAVLVCLFIPLSVYFSRKRKHRELIPSPLVIHPRDPSDSRDAIKIVITDNTNRSASSLTNASGSVNSNASRVIEAGNLVISVQVLRNVTKNFAVENELGRGGFGVVYKGDLDDGTKIAVKRMEGGTLSSKALEEFQSEIEVLSKVRHRHLVSLLGYSVEGNERILVYEYMPQGPLSKHLFHWKKMRVEPLSWKRRLNISLDVARGMEYLHSLAHQSFIHRDLKSSNILLDDDFRAKVSDFGLVKLAPDGEKSVATQLAGTFGYLAPEYAETGKITTKADVYSFGVILMELLSGMVALDEKRADERQYLVPWFKKMKSNEEALKAAIDPSLDVKGEAFESMSIICELAGHCTAREPGQRPDMGRAVNVLASLVEKWKPRDENEEEEEYCGIDYSLPLDEMVKGWQEAEGKEMGVMDTEGSLPATPLGFVDSFHSADAR